MVVYRFAVAGVLCAVVACGIGGVAAGARPLIIDTDIGTGASLEQLQCHVGSRFV